jgi:hypothetical protein
MFSDAEISNFIFSLSRPINKLTGENPLNNFLNPGKPNTMLLISSPSEIRISFNIISQNINYKDKL